MNHIIQSTPPCNTTAFGTGEKTAVLENSGKGRESYITD